MEKPNKSQIFWTQLGIVGGLASIVSIPLSIYLFIQSKESKEPKFVTEPPFQIVNPGELDDPPFTVLKKNGDEIKNPINIQRFYFWNAGKEAIKSEDILQDLIIDLSINELIGEEILDFQCTSISRKDVTGFNLSKADKNSILINFDILEKNDGATCQIILEGSADTSISGAIEGVGTLSNQSLLPRDEDYAFIMIVRAFFVISSLIAILNIFRSDESFAAKAIMVIPCCVALIYFVPDIAREIVSPNKPIRYNENFQPSYQIPYEITE